MLKLKFYKTFTLLIILIILLLPKKILAFQEEFNSSPLDDSIWGVNQNGGNITISSGFINLSSGNTRNFPFVFSKSNLFPESENFSIKFGIKYNNTTSKGNGIIFSTEIPLNKTEYTRLTDPFFSKRHFLGVWQDSIKGFSLWFCGDCYNSDCSSEEFFVYKKNNTDLNYHNIEFKYFSNKYHLFIDSNEVFVSNYTLIKPSYIWFGNSTNQGLGDSWTGFSIDYIKIDSEIIPTSTPIPTPTPTPLQPIILLPGLGGSWNHENIILGIEKPQSKWYMTPGIKIYDGLIETLKNSGYKTSGEDKNLFVFNYNWTKPVTSIVDDFKNYIQNIVNPDEGIKIDLIGHSLGGLVARAYVQNNQDNPVDQLLTLGSPLKGIPSIYYLWEGGNLNKSFTPWQRISIGLLLHLRKIGFYTTTEAVRSVVPVLKDLLPTFNYLKENSKEKSLDQMSQKNDWLISINNFLPNHLLSINNIVGIIPNSTVRWIYISQQSWLDKLLGIWIDGKPINDENDYGDQTILKESAFLNGSHIFNLTNINHQELVTSIVGQQKIMEILSLNQESISDLSVNLSYEPALVFQIASPAIINVTDNEGNQVGEGDEKLIIIPNAKSGKYQIELNGIDNGQYHLYIGQITKNQDFWTSVSDSINNGEKISYRINFDSSSPLANPLINESEEDYFKTLQNQILYLKNTIEEKNIPPIVKKLFLLNLKKINSLFNQSNFEKAIISLYQLRVHLSLWERIWKLEKNDICLLKNLIQEIIENGQKAYILFENQKEKPYRSKQLHQEIKLTKKFLNKMTKKLKIIANEGIINPEYGALYLLAEEKLMKAESSNSFESHINTIGAQFLSQEGFFLLK